MKRIIANSHTDSLIQNIETWVQTQASSYLEMANDKISDQIGDTQKVFIPLFQVLMTESGESKYKIIHPLILGQMAVLKKMSGRYSDQVKDPKIKPQIYALGLATLLEAAAKFPDDTDMHKILVKVADQTIAHSEIKSIQSSVKQALPKDIQTVGPRLVTRLKKVYQTNF